MIHYAKLGGPSECEGPCFVATASFQLHMASRRTKGILLFSGTLLVCLLLKLGHRYFVGKYNDDLINGDFLFNTPTMKSPVVVSVVGLNKDKKRTAKPKTDSLYGAVECDRSGQTCAFQNLVIGEDGEYRVYLKRKGYSRYAGIILSEGIGSPSRYFYIDSWSKWDEKPSRVELAAEKEIDSMDPRPIPIYLSPLRHNQDLKRVDGLTVQISILWPDNFFRVFYGFAAAWSTLSRWDLTVMRPIRFELGDIPFSNQALDFITRAFPVNFTEQTNQCVCHERAIIGISRHAWLDETAFRVDSGGLALRTKGFQDFATRLKATLSVPRIPANALPLILFVGRKTNRRVLNMSEVMHETLMRFGSQVRVKLVYLELLPLPEQIDLVQQARVVVGVHGAALTHILFMRKGSFVVEIFPFGFKKVVYRDLARCLGINYLSYQVPRPEGVRFLKDDNTAMALALERGEPDWGCYQADPTCLRQKEWWRAQDFSVDPEAFLAHLSPVFPLDKPAYTTGRYLLFMPWEQFGNQMVEFKSACAMAIALNRTLVLPPVGFFDARKAEGLDPMRRRWYNPRHYNWRPFSRYFEGTETLPCATVPWDAFTGLAHNLDALMYRAADETDPQKCRQRTEWFYYEEAAMKWSNSPQIFYALQVKPDELATRRAMQTPRVLALGNVFMMAQLGPWIRFPVTRYTDLYTGSPLYAQMVLPYRKELKHLVWALLHCSKSPLAIPFDAAHIRRGDYRDKCIDDAKARNIKTLRQFISCWQPDAYLERRLANPKRPLYIATNGPPDSINIKGRRTLVFLRDLRPALRVSKPSAGVSKEDLARAWETLRWADPIELAIIDQLICAAAVKFTGNLYSSFTRAILDQVHRTNPTTRHSFF